MFTKCFIRGPFFVARINNLLNNDRAVIVSYSKGAINLKVIIVVLNLSVGIHQYVFDAHYWFVVLSFIHTP